MERKISSETRSAPTQGSISSLSTDSSSSHTLKTPHSKYAGPDPIIVSSSGSLDNALAHPVPALPVVTKEGPVSPSPIAKQPLEAVRLEPLKQSLDKPAARPSGGSSQPRSPQGWGEPSDDGMMCMMGSGPSSLPVRPMRSRSTNQPVGETRVPSQEAQRNAGYPRAAPPPALGPPASSSSQSSAGAHNRLSQDWIKVPPQSMAERTNIQNSISPRRPNFERALTDSAAASYEGKSQRAGRMSADQLRPTSASAPRSRHNSMSTPPALALMSSHGSTAGTKVRLLRPIPKLTQRRSEDMLRRPSEDGPGLMSRGGAAISPATGNVAGTSETKSSGLSLKKSTGALKALFRGGANKSKDRASSQTPPLPSLDPHNARSRPSTSGSRVSSEGSPRFQSRLESPSLTPSPLIWNASPATAPTASQAPRRSMDPQSQGVVDARHRVLTSEKATYPSSNRPHQPSNPAVRLPPSMEKGGSADTMVAGQPTLAEALPSSSLPYLNALARASMIVESEIRQSVYGGHSPLPTSDSSTSSQDVLVDSPIKHSRSLHLLSLPDLDLDFDGAFDSIGVSPASTPNKHRPAPAPPKDSPTPTPSPTQHKGDKVRRRRSLSLDAPLQEADWSLPMLPTTSAPIMREPSIRRSVVQQAQSQHSLKLSISSGSNELMQASSQSSDHSQGTPSASETGLTPSPSPPKTPTEPITIPTRMSLDRVEAALQADARTETKQPTLPPQIPLPPTPAALQPSEKTSMVVPPTMVKRIPSPIERLVSDVDKTGLKPRERTRSLQRRSKIVVPDGNWSWRGLAREVGRLLAV